MPFINSLSLAPAVQTWLANSRQPSILHVFDHVCNLINEHRDVLSIVTPQIGNGPFNLVIEDDVLFSDHLRAQSPISIRENRLDLGDLTIHTAGAKLWSSRPDWEKLHGKRVDIHNQLALLPSSHPQFASLSSALVSADISSALPITRQLAGLGGGLTPTGDDFILGAIYAAWIIHPLEVASVLAEEITSAAAPLTTSLSAAFLRSAGKGEAGILWHRLFDALMSDNPVQTQDAMEHILEIGASSGADALSGFLSTFISYAEPEIKNVIPG